MRGEWTGRPSRRCGVTSLGGELGCCREEYHDGGCCGHETGYLTGTPGWLATRGPLGTSWGRCPGTAGRPITPQADYPDATAKQRQRLRRLARQEGTT